MSIPNPSSAQDPTVAWFLCAIVALAFVGALGSLRFDYSLADMLPMFGGLVVVLGSYFAARTLRENEVDKATQALASDRAAVRVAGVTRLGGLAHAHRYRSFVVEVLTAYVAESKADDPGRRRASSILKELQER